MQKESYSRADSSPLFSGKSTFFTGCNYWASHAGTFMWRNWDADRVEKDFQRLSAHKARVLRVFPLWCDFQPLTLHFECGQTPCEYRMGEEALPDTPFGQAGMDPVMMERFHTFCRLAEKYQLKLIVGLITGWMSGRVYAPAAFEKKNLLTDPEVIHFQVKFIRTFVKDMKEEKAIAAWDWGNECNCLGPHSVEEMWLWQECMSNAILREDTSRPIISGLHGDKVPPPFRQQGSVQIFSVPTPTPPLRPTVRSTLWTLSAAPSMPLPKPFSIWGPAEKRHLWKRSAPTPQATLPPGPLPPICAMPSGIPTPTTVTGLCGGAPMIRTSLPRPLMPG